MPEEFLVLIVFSWGWLDFSRESKADEQQLSAGLIKDDAGKRSGGKNESCS